MPDNKLIERFCRLFRAELVETTETGAYVRLAYTEFVNWDVMRKRIAEREDILKVCLQQSKEYVEKDDLSTAIFMLRDVAPANLHDLAWSMYQSGDLHRNDFPLLWEKIEEVLYEG